MTNRAGLPDYDSADRFPARVWRAVEETRQHGFPLACLPEVGRLLQLCAGLAGVDRVCELGTAYGVGAAWIESGLRRGATLLTVEVDTARAESARRLVADNPALEVLTGDWSLALEREPFDLVFSDGGPKRHPGDPEKLLPLVRSGGLMVLDDYTPGFASDASREIWLESPDYRAQEVQLADSVSVILAVKR